MNVVTRFPPSPTGYFHIGSARTALFNYLFAAKAGGVMYLRFEDTDKERSKKEYEEDIIAGLHWLQIPYTLANPLRQSEKIDVYRTYLHKLIEKGAAYEAEAGEKGGKVVRFKNPNVRVTFSDLIRGEVSFETAELKDFVIARNADDPLYNFAVVVDDGEMGITHVIRGEDHISNTQRQILIQEALGFERPIYAHIPLILAPDRSKLSKRNFAASVNDYRGDGYIPQAFLNYLVLLGWTPPSGKEKLSLKEIIGEFDIQNVHKSGAIFDLQKLKWLNREYMLEIPDDEYLAEMLRRAHSWDKGIAAKLVPLVKERVGVWQEFDTVKHDFEYFFSEPKPDPAKLPGKGSDAEAGKKHLGHLRKLFAAMPSQGEMTADQVKTHLWEYAEAEGRGKVLWPLRYALTGREKSPDPFTVASIIGKEVALRRIDAALQTL
ncbi:hypothetical protein A3A40_03550 [Candidatus Kaiserbacteria bacterium RIFCSPLOWO2_01_FULL_54_20]|uniref:Glutamate--tRNA ligase n=1 Tax=Candidatus Kaiserbacteria bacterium RIFCSPLOWO2_01_FULL_54_20 TaxID=1798513 RepID=A0A1F6EK72_9BACT|nr:MAG: hypothetical protein A3A40_03550 [Candidatus Kaiserbacteria bacterium RIFCSPLOWO2_01_FULL_54_20]